MAFVGIFVIVGLAALVCGIVVLIDVFKYPESAFQAAGQNRVLWIVLPIVGIFFCGLISIVAAALWFSDTKKKVAAAA